MGKIPNILRVLGLRICLWICFLWTFLRKLKLWTKGFFTGGSWRVTEEPKYCCQEGTERGGHVDLAFYTPRVLSTGHTAHLSWGDHCTMPSYACTRVVCVGHELKYEANALRLLWECYARESSKYIEGKARFYNLRTEARGGRSIAPYLAIP